MIDMVEAINITAMQYHSIIDEKNERINKHNNNKKVI
jgi:hypothetical protein